MSLFASLGSALSSSVTSVTGLIGKLTGNVATADVVHTMGIDIGTTAIKVCIVRSAIDHLSLSHSYTHTIVSYSEADHRAGVTVTDRDSGAEYDEQCVDTILLTLQACLRSLPPADKQLVDYIGLAGAMHGCVLWHDKKCKACVSQLLQSGSANSMIETKCHSHLYTWRDGRASQSTLQALNASIPVHDASTPAIQGAVVYKGYGVATLAEFAKSSPSKLLQYTRSGTIADYVLWLMLNVRDKESSLPVSYPAYQHPSMAASYGCFDCDKNNWQMDRIQAAKIPLSLMPAILNQSQSPLFKVSHFMAQLLTLGSKCEASVAIGDSTAALYAIQPRQHEMVVNVGTAAQLSVLFDYSEDSEYVDDSEAESSQLYSGDTVIGDQSLTVTDTSSESVDDDDFHPPRPPQSVRHSTSVPDMTMIRAPSEYRPYLTNTGTLLVVASTVGGNLLEALALTLQSIHYRMKAQLDQSINDTDDTEYDLRYFYSTMLSDAQQYEASVNSQSYPYDSEANDDSVNRSLQLLVAANVSLSQLQSTLTQAMHHYSVGKLTYMLCELIADSLHSSLHRGLSASERRRLKLVTHCIAVGGAVRRNPVLRNCIERKFGLHVQTRPPMACEWKKQQLLAQPQSQPANLSEDDMSAPWLYHPDAAFGAAIQGIARVVEKRRKEAVAADAGRLFDR